ncbi:type I-B CRISPR-associated protein Cas7/Cst2/DevR [Heliobacterium gestii]|uniref:Type I-B CRISPR-associated protein Cas7/Cst2/DevR n=1 Tax=Heliomicrobium gestii TaxID=2699 RepID=A0A845L8U4_HELGE|nr:type I-B CRISPR-associated protein Cas7/Cst2/DevR [Heliomicrobium gestii]MBM7865384.1 CRISPR-associated protein Cst2 [Heliomicrobium gestii]MZP41644.1 type I-B CRISPR-associated protein Cas7/Cst2/DevR [Heliomicrobium gestii]
MAFLSGVFLIDCPASALNNAGKTEAINADNAIAVKSIQTREGAYPYVSAQAFRYWWRESLRDVQGWSASPIFREGKIAYTDANPLLYAEDDLFGYMRAQSTKEDAKKKREETGLLDKATPVAEKVTLTRQSPLKVSTLVSVAPVREITKDFGVMARQEGAPVPFEHEFYRAALQGLFSVDLGMMGRFYHIQRTGYKHLDGVRVEMAREMGLEEYDDGKAYQLSLEDRHQRLQMLMQGFAKISGGAKQSIHYTDVSPRLVILAVAKGGNHLFGTTVGTFPDGYKRGLPQIKLEALKETARVMRDEIVSGIYVGLTQGYLDEQRGGLIAALQEIQEGEIYGFRKTFLGHPREAIEAFLNELNEGKEQWLR